MVFCNTLNSSRAVDHFLTENQISTVNYHGEVPAEERFVIFFTLFFSFYVPSAESSRSVRGLGKGVSGKPYPHLCNARRPRLEPGTFRSQAVRLYRLQV